MGHVNPFVHIVPYAPLILNTRGTWSVWPLISFPYPRDPFAHTTLATFLHSRWANGTRVRLGMSMEEAIASHVVPSGSLIKTFTHSCYGLVRQVVTATIVTGIARLRRVTAFSLYNHPSYASHSTLVLSIPTPLVTLVS